MSIGNYFKASSNGLFDIGDKWDESNEGLWKKIQRFTSLIYIFTFM
ncbi:hypothetical protein NGB41_12700 [Staphylococcus equorum]|nr:hypothetical protein [Staphylococcus equorum]MEB7691186.1 hypothetical protein [Staphylococcus equorum]